MHYICSSYAAPESEALQVQDVSEAAEHRWWSGRPYSAGAQIRARKVRFFYPLHLYNLTNRRLSLPRIENALPGRDGYEVEIFGMEGIPAPDVADWKRRKEIELGLNPGTITQPQAKRPKIENRVLTQEELRVQLEAHKALMGAVDNTIVAPPPDAATGAVVNAAPQTYVAPPTGISPPAPGVPPFMPNGPPPAAISGVPSFPPFPGAPGFHPGYDQFNICRKSGHD